ncbi:hypothetical protein AAE478_005648 [Parahypoxylon ruwenzoriense]
MHNPLQQHARYANHCWIHNSAILQIQDRFSQFVKLQRLFRTCRLLVAQRFLGNENPTPVIGYSSVEGETPLNAVHFTQPKVPR